MDDEETYETERLAGVKFSPWVLLLAAANGAQAAAETLAAAVGMHLNYELDRTNFANRAGYELNTLLRNPAAALDEADEDFDEEDD
mgnify:CR=1 FL=1